MLTHKHYLTAGLALLSICLWATPVGSVEKKARAVIFSGPMSGVPKGASTQLWLQSFPAVDVHIHYWAVENPSNKKSVSGITGEDGIFRVDIGGLVAKTQYHYQVSLNGRLLAETYRFKTLPQQYFPKEHDVSFLYGSCSNWKRDRYPLIETMADHQADFVLWLGDNLYLQPWEYDRAEGIERKYAHVRRHPSLNRLLSSKGQVATWDDHDFGRNDATRHWKYSDEAQRVFSRYWLNPSPRNKTTKGIQTQFQVSDIDFILLDGRSFRDHPNLGESPQMFGHEQLLWAKNNLLNSRAKLKILASGNQWLNEHNTFEGWNRYEEEQQAFLSWLAEKDIPGVIFLSGDRHFTEMLKLEREGTYPLYEASCSPLTAGFVRKMHNREKKNPLRVEGTLVRDNNYCEIRVTGEKEKRALSIRSIDKSGKTFWEKQIRFAEIGL